MLYRYIGRHGAVIPHGIGVKQYNFGDIIKSEVPLSELGVPEGRYEAIPTDKEEPVIKQEIVKKEFEINEANKKLEEKEEEFDNQLQDMEKYIKKLENEKRKLKSDLIKETSVLVKPKEAPKASKSKEEVD